MINLAIVSDIRLYCDGIEKLLEKTDGINIGGTAINADEALTLLDHVHIDVFLLNMRITTCEEILTLFTKKHVNAKIIVINDFEGNSYNVTHCASKINAYLPGSSTIEELIATVNIVHKSDSYYSADTPRFNSTGIKVEYISTDKEQNVHPAPFNDLTRRESQIIKLLAQGLSNKQIARVLAIEISTVKNHVHNILVKLGVESRARVACLFRDNSQATLNPPGLPGSSLS